MPKYDPTKLNTQVVKGSKVKLVSFLNNNITRPKGRILRAKKLIVKRAYKKYGKEFKRSVIYTRYHSLTSINQIHCS